eukprot:11822708-Ditylum_brightwellii.AAC.1
MDAWTKELAVLLLVLILVGCLGVSYGFQDIVEAHCCLAVMEQRTTLCFCCGAYHMFKCSALNKNGGIVWCLAVVESMWVGGTIEVAGDAAFGAIDNKVCGVRANVQLHVASKKAEHCIWIYC